MKEISRDFVTQGGGKVVPYLHKNGKTYLCWAKPDGSAGAYVMPRQRLPPEFNGRLPDGVVESYEDGAFFLVRANVSYNLRKEVRRKRKKSKTVSFRINRCYD